MRHDILLTWFRVGSGDLEYNVCISSSLKLGNDLIICLFVDPQQLLWKDIHLTIETVAYLVAPSYNMQVLKARTCAIQLCPSNPNDMIAKFAKRPTVNALCNHRSTIMIGMCCQWFGLKVSTRQRRDFQGPEACSCVQEMGIGKHRTTRPI